MILDLGTSSSQKISKLNYPSEWGRFLGTFDNKIDLKIINPTFQEWDFPNSLQDEEKIFSDSKDDFLEYFINFLEIRSRLMAGKLKRIFLETLED